MKKEKIIEEFCPYCKRHCPLSNPYCKKGKALVEEKKKIAQGDLEELNKLSTAKLSQLQDETRLLSLFRKCASVLPDKKEQKSRSLKKKYYVLSILEQKDKFTPKELQNYSKLSKEKLEGLLLKLEDKNYISQNKESAKANTISITESGLIALKENRVKRENRELKLFDSLSEEETEQFQHILEKLYTHWNSAE